ncbi:MAG: malonate transporter subunit MadM [Cyclobacteriaceae bacterium]|nr:malonate transporter subunit MadM [Cyclobacteriaceae bacterium]
METLSAWLTKDGVLIAGITVAAILGLSTWISIHVTRKKIPGPAIAIFAGLALAYFVGEYTGGKNGVADLAIFSGFAVLGGSMLRDFTIVATAMGARFSEMSKAGWAGVVALFLGVVVSFTVGALLALGMGYSDARSMATLGAGACTFIVGPVTGAAVGASSEVIALSIAAGVIKSIAVTIVTPWVAHRIGLDNPQSAMVFGGLIGTTSGVAAGLAATDPKLVPYGAITATFYTGLGCLLCPSVLYLVLQWLAG